MGTVKIGEVELGVKPAFFCTILEENAEAAIRQATEAENAGASVLEFRLDKFVSLDEAVKAVSTIKFPKLAVCRHPAYDGFFKGSDAEKAEMLIAGIEAGANAVDVDATMMPENREKVVKAARAKGIPVIICYENFEGVPEKAKLLEILKWEEAIGADVAKVAVKANSYEDLLTVLQVVREAKKQLNVPFIAIAMGAHGKPSRVLSPVLGGAGTYCCTVKGKEGAPGQMPLKETKEMIELFTRS